MTGSDDLSIAELASAALDGELDAEQLRVASGTAEFVETLARLEASRAALRSAPPPPADPERREQALRVAMAAIEGNVLPFAPVAARPSRRWTRWALPAIGVAAAAFVVGMGVVVSRGGDSTPGDIAITASTVSAATAATGAPSQEAGGGASVSDQPVDQGSASSAKQPDDTVSGGIAPAVATTPLVPGTTPRTTAAATSPPTPTTVPQTPAPPPSVAPTIDTPPPAPAPLVEGIADDADLRDVGRRSDAGALTPPSGPSTCEAPVSGANFVGTVTWSTGALAEVFVDTSDSPTRVWAVATQGCQVLADVPLA